VPRQQQSGQVDRKGRITERGPRLLCKVPVEAAWLMLRHNAREARLFARLTRGRRVRRKPALVALARKRLVRCWAMLRTGSPWREEVVVA
jgi:transposase